MLDSLGSRMKRYEEATRTVVTPRTPIIIRVDGGAFHTYTRPLQTFDVELGAAMIEVATELCKEIQGAQLAYTQSDEVSVLVHPYKRFASSTWFDGQVQKIVSVSASIAATIVTARSPKIFGHIKMAKFDSRVFVLPEAEVCNYFVWRQQDGIRNSVQSLARTVFSQEQCDHKNQDELKSILANKGIPWPELESAWKYGSVIDRNIMPDGGIGPWRSRPAVPLFTKGRAQVEDLLVTEEEK